VERDDALAELAARYFSSHGPATIEDFTWWAGITVKDAETALEAAHPRLAREAIGDREYFWGSARPPFAKRSGANPAPRVKLLPGFDEYTVAYADRALLLARGKRMSPMGLLSPVVVVDGQVAGTWKRSFEKDSVKLAVKLLRPLTRVEKRGFGAAAQEFAEFLGRPVKLPGSITRG